MPTRPSRRCSRAFTLLEVILALAILAGSVAVLGEIMRTANRSAADAHAETRAQMLAASVMDQVVCGVIEAVDQSQVVLETDDAVTWTYSLTISQTSLSDLISVEVNVEQLLEPQYNPVKYRLVRWIAQQQAEDDSGSEEDQSTEEDDAA